MRPGNRQEVEEIFHQALLRDPGQRDAFVCEACHGDSELHREVSSLLAHHGGGTGAEPWAARAAAQLIDSSVSLQPGQLLGPYRIESFVAAGGMGQVYRAMDTRLNRPVAIKLCAGPFSERFAQEAKVIASLNHPHICQLYDVGSNYLVMEFVEGTPLRGPLPLKQAVEYAGQILDALDTAHRKGITHRDLKPANILVTKQGVKLLDFGLAKRSAPFQPTDATVTAGLTGKGEILGTLQYMSPEQLQGKEADARSDLFSFGCVLYEMLSGKRAFEGQSAASVIAAILEREPAPLDLASLDRVIRTCLAKEPDHRFQTATDLKRALSWALEQPSAPKASRRAWIAVAMAAMLVAAGGGWAVFHFRQSSADDHVIRFQIAPPEGVGISGGGNLGGGFAISPDGQNVAFIGVVKGKTGLWVRPLDAANARLIRGSESASRPFWSPDSRSIAFGTGSVLQRVDLSRETISKICDVRGVYSGGSWSDDGRILFVIRDVGIFQVPASGGSPAQVTAIDLTHGEHGHGNPLALPGGHFLYQLMTQESQSQEVYAASLAKSAEKIRLLANAFQVQYASAGNGEDYLLWIRDQTLVAQRFNTEKLQLIGEPRPIVDPVATASIGGRSLIYGSDIALRQLKWLDRKGKELGLLGEPGPWAFNRISPDGRRVATTRVGRLWLVETGRGVASLLTSTGGLNPLWSPDGRTVLFSRLPGIIYRINADGSGKEEPVTESTERRYATDWSRDGRFVIYTEEAQERGRDLWVLPVTPDGRLEPGAKPRPFVREPLDQHVARFSPDTRWVAYQSNESGQWEVYVRSFPEAREKLHISTAGGDNPQWGAGGHELFYRSREGKLMVVTLKSSGTSLDASLPRELFTLPPSLPGPTPYEVTADGQRFLVSDVAANSEPLNVIVNWPALLKKGAPAP
jgi:Tol biopolymer transport system component/predicted Ser/Thr protein kinase